MKKWIIALTVSILVLSGCGTTASPPKNKTGSPTSQTNNKGNGSKMSPSGVKPFANQASQTPDLGSGQEKNNRKPQALTLAQLHAKYPTFFVLQGSSQKNQVALTFDDAPDDVFTPQVLDVLKQHNVKATFFVVGNRAEKYPDIVKRMYEEGHNIGNHSYNHSNLPKLADDRFRDQVNLTQQAIKNIIGHEPKYIRPPYGNISEEQIKWLASQNLRMINWNVDSLDWQGLNADQIMSNIMSHLGPGSIVLQHSAGGTGEDLTGTIEALPRLIKYLRDHNMEPVTVSELLDLPAFKD